MNDRARAKADQAARDLRLLHWRMLQHQHTQDQLLAALDELEALGAVWLRTYDQATGEPTVGATARPAPTSTEEHVVLLRVSARSYALPIGRVRQILPPPAGTRVSDREPGVAAAFRWRGRILPIVDLAVRLGMPAPERGASAWVVVAESASGVVGLLVDGVPAVLRLPAGSIETAIGYGAAGAYVVEKTEMGGCLVELLDLDAALGRAEPD